MSDVRSSDRWRGAMSSRIKDGLGQRLNPWGLASKEHGDDTYTESLCPYFMDLGQAFCICVEQETHAKEIRERCICRQ